MDRRRLDDVSSPPIAATDLSTVVARTVPIEGELDLNRLPASGGLAWLRPDAGLLAWGELARLETSGPDRFARAADWWSEISASLRVEDPVDVRGSGPIAFGSFGFADDATSVLIVPRVIIGQRDGRTWMTTIGAFEADRDDAQIAAPGRIRWSAGDVSAAAFGASVRAAVARIAAHDAEKIVLARDLLARADHDIDERYVLSRLRARFGECWTYAVEGLVGATPEMLIRREGAQVSSRVLAGTAWRSSADSDDTEVDAWLRSSAKNMAEHEYAARSAAEALRPYCVELTVPSTPSVLRLSNVTHLATDIAGRLARGVSALELAGVLHPTAAVGGTPAADAVRIIGEIEGMDRGRYAGPVGWVDTAGDGEFGIALRGALFTGSTARLYAGGGIVAGSDPDDELAETDAKFAVIRDALEGI